MPLSESGGFVFWGFFLEYDIVKICQGVSLHGGSHTDIIWPVSGSFTTHSEHLQF